MPLTKKCSLKLKFWTKTKEDTRWSFNYKFWVYVG